MRWVICLGPCLLASSSLACSGSDAAPPNSAHHVEAASHCDAPIAHPKDDALRLFDVQMKSTHNSYHLETEGNDVNAWGYSLAPLDVQLEQQGVRHFELDIHRDLEAGGFLVYHVGVLDERTTCVTLTDCLSTMKAWSEEHPGHHPILVHVEPKDALPADIEAYVKELDETITGVWSSHCIVTPDSVSVDGLSLSQALKERGWPTLGSVRGKILFTLLDRGPWREAYTRGEDNIDGRLFFAEGDPGAPYAAVTRVDDPVAGADEIVAALAANMLVRTRCDTDSVEALANDTTRRDAALASGAHMVSTDYPAPVDGLDYWLEIPDGTPSRCNPVTADGGCTSEAIEDPTRLEP